MWVWFFEKNAEPDPAWKVMRIRPGKKCGPRSGFNLENNANLSQGAHLDTPPCQKRNKKRNETDIDRAGWVGWPRRFGAGKPSVL